ncbi:peroxiredoxin [Salinarimonas ramus]|uniref:Glutathione-dependent peroxiredoxin n=1 Tax=Salinarimonas ramus TaxID=690164 RepID=A0A917V712_9HYPH|nr:peroxiredoxin [Salinarimonas ramus]GGK45301.1 peroxiredoxin [Salinarimonas ramus]
MTIKVGDRLPEVTFRAMSADGPVQRTSQAVFEGRKVVLIAVPGAYTPTCTLNHVPGYITHADALKAKGVDAIVVTSVNDPFVMGAWEKSLGADGKLEFVADGNGDFARAIGLELDGSGFGLGLRSKRYSMIVEDGVVKALNVEDAPGKADASGAEAMLGQL